MTMMDTDLEDLIGTDSGGQHIKCCQNDTFLCGAPFHPEVAAPDDAPDDECCPECVKVRTMLSHFGHTHCPANFSIICPPRRKK
jgi:hypothetical protein